ncbi:MAG: FAD:protein FMN transferase [Acidimicrobiia bacterium]
MASLHIHDPAPDGLLAAAADAVMDELERLEEMFSTFRPSSEISRIHAGALHHLDASAEVIEVLDACTWLEHDSDGAFRARRPDGRLDPAGYVKGWAAELATAALRDAGLTSWYLAVGGDIQASGPLPDGTPWRFGISDPRRAAGRRGGDASGDGVVAVVEMNSGAMATSGTAARGRHLWDGRTGDLTEPLASMTVIGPQLRWADAFATAAFVMGVAGLTWVARHEGYHAIAVTMDDRLLSTDGAPLLD